MSYQIQVQVDQFWVDRFDQDQTQFCYSFGVDDTTAPGTHFNIVSGAVFVASNIVVTWKDNFTIAATELVNTSTATIRGATAQVHVKSQERVQLAADGGELSAASDDDKLSAGTFAFDNKHTASAVLYKEVEGQPVIFYVSANGPNPPGESIFTPKPVCRLFFSPRIAVGSLVGSYISETLDVDLTGKSKATVTFNKDGHWNLASSS